MNHRSTSTSETDAITARELAALARLRKKLERQELPVLRQLLTQMAEELESVKARLDDAEAWAETARRSADDAWEQLYDLMHRERDDGATFGLTIDGRVLRLPAENPDPPPCDPHDAAPGHEQDAEAIEVAA